MLAPQFVPASFLFLLLLLLFVCLFWCLLLLLLFFVTRAIFLRALLCMALMWGDQVSFLSNFSPRYVEGVLVDFLSIDLQDELFSLGRQGEAGGFSLSFADHNQPLFCPA